MKLNTVIRSAIVLALVGQTAIPAASAQQSAVNGGNGISAAQRKNTAAIDESSALALNLLIAATILEQESGRLGAADPDVVRKYENIRRAYLGAVPTSSAGGIAYYLGAESLRTVEFLIKPLTALLRGLYNASVFASERSWDLMKLLRLDVVINRATDISSNAFTYSHDYIFRPIIGFLITQNTLVSSGSSSATSVFAGSVFFMMNGANEALSYEQVRQILGQNDAVRARVDEAVTMLAPVFNLDAVKQSQLKIAIYDEVLRQAIENNFSEDMSKYNLDVVELMEKNNMIDKEVAQAVNKLRELAATIDVTGSRSNSTQIIQENVDMALALAAILETKLNSGEITNSKIAAELQRMLGGISARLALIGFNLKR